MKIEKGPTAPECHFILSNNKNTRSNFPRPWSNVSYPYTSALPSASSWSDKVIRAQNVAASVPEKIEANIFFFGKQCWRWKMRCKKQELAKSRTIVNNKQRQQKTVLVPPSASTTATLPPLAPLSARAEDKKSTAGVRAERDGECCCWCPLLKLDTPSVRSDSLTVTNGLPLNIPISCFFENQCFAQKRNSKCFTAHCVL